MTGAPGKTFSKPELQIPHLKKNWNSGFVLSALTAPPEATDPACFPYHAGFSTPGTMDAIQAFASDFPPVFPYFGAYDCLKALQGAAFGPDFSIFRRRMSMPSPMPAHEFSVKNIPIDHVARMLLRLYQKSSPN